MKVELVIRTDSVLICDTVVEAPRTIDAILATLGTSKVDHLRDLKFANICIQARPHDPMRAPAARRTFNQEANGVA